MIGYFTHIWDVEEWQWYVAHRDTMLFAVPACGAERDATREHKRPYLVLPEEILERGTLQTVRCPICRKINDEILTHGDVEYDCIWDAPAYEHTHDPSLARETAIILYS